MATAWYAADTMTGRPMLYADNRWLPQAEWEPLAQALHVPRERLVVKELGGQDRTRLMQPWVEIPLDDDWTSVARLAAQGGQLVVAELRLFPNEPDRRRRDTWSAALLGPLAPVPRGGLTVATVRKARLGDYRRRTRQILEQIRKQYGTTGAALTVEALGLPPDAQSMTRPRAARAGTLPDAFYARLAAEYVRLIERGSRRPVVELATRHRLRPAQMRDRIHEARERGLLTLGYQGRPGGVVTPRAQAMLRTRTNPRARRPHR
jgi:hypothetical protein